MQFSGDTYFAAGQPASRFFITFDLWQSSLFNSLLFQPNIHIADGALLGNPYVWNHLNDPIRQDKTSWLEEALTKKWITVRIRSEKQIIELAKELISTGFTVMDNKALTVAERLEKLEIHSKLWSENYSVSFGESFCNRLKAELERDIPQGYDSLEFYEVGKRLLGFWTGETGEHWRKEWVLKSKYLTKMSGNSGLRVSDLVKVAAEELNIKLHSKNFSPLELINAIPEEKKQLKENLIIYFKIITEIYDLNFSDRIGCRNSAVNLDALTASVVLGPEKNMEWETDEIQLTTITIPNLDELRRAPSHILSFLRESDVGEAYFADLISWLNSGDDISVENLGKSIKKYADLISRTIKQNSSRPLKNVKTYSGKRYLSTLLAGGIASIIFHSPSSLVSGFLTLLISDAFSNRKSDKKIEIGLLQASELTYSAESIK